MGYGQIKGRRLYFKEDFLDKKSHTYRHCCKQMNFHIHEKEKIITYLPRFRSFGIRVNKSICQSIAFCPWCGTALPSDLSDEFWELIEELEKKQGFEFDDLQDKRLPAEFKTDAWWKKRGL